MRNKPNIKDFPDQTNVAELRVKLSNGDTYEFIAVIESLNVIRPPPLTDLNFPSVFKHIEPPKISISIGSCGEITFTPAPIKKKKVKAKKKSKK